MGVGFINNAVSRPTGMRNTSFAANRLIFHGLKKVLHFAGTAANTEVACFVDHGNARRIIAPILKTL